MIYFNSDYLEGAHPSIMVRLAETNMVQTVGYGEDEYCEAAREKIKTCLLYTSDAADDQHHRHRRHPAALAGRDFRRQRSHQLP